MRPHPVSLARRSLICAAVLSAAAAVAPAPARAWGSGERVTGSGKIVTESRALSGYTAIRLKASFKVVVRASGREGVELRGDDNLLPLIETQVVESGDGRALELRWRDGVSISHRDNVVVTVDVADLRAISVAGSGSVVSEGLKTTSLGLAVAGSGDIKVTQLQAGDCGVKLSGSGDVLLSGRASSLAVSVAGSGDVDAQALEAAQVAVKIAGSGDVSVNASQSLAVSIAGSGDVKHRGAAQPQVSVSGSGRVRRV